MGPDPPRTPPGRVPLAGRYLLLEELGAGASGTVYEARDERLGRLLAVKTMRMDAAPPAALAEALVRFRHEARFAAQLKHPGIVAIYDVGEAEGRGYIAMELVPGSSLDRLLARLGRLPIARAAGIAAQVAEALDFAHRHGVVHRDVKPANIMVTPEDAVKVTDFGIARPTQSADELPGGGLLGTPSYMSPEQARGAALDGRSDLFSLGCVLYEMVSGRKAFHGDTITALLFRIIAQEPQPLREILPSASPAIEGVIARATAKAKERRYASGREMAEELRALSRPD